MDKFSREAHRVLDIGKTSPRFDPIEWVNSFVAQRIKNLPKRDNEDRMIRKINRLTFDPKKRENDYQGITLMETSSRIYHNYTQESIDSAWAYHFGMKPEDLAHVA